MKIAIIGTGISGNSLAWMLNEKYDITVFEKNDYVGGHSNTIEVDYNGNKIAVDTGFIVYNHKTYPYLKKLFEILCVETLKSEMSFGISVENGLEYCVRSFRGLFADWKNFFNPKFYKMLFDIIQFNKKATQFVKKNENLGKFELSEMSLGEFLRSLKVGTYFMEYFLLPMAGAIWSCPSKKMLDYPALSFLRFYHNHGLLTAFNQPQWHTVKGGSKEYVKLLTNNFKEKIKLSQKIICVEKEGEKIAVINDKGEKNLYDKVVFANHADEVLQIAKSLPQEASEVLKNFKYQENIAILHKDKSQMPKRKSAYASWIYLKGKGDDNKCSVSYWMNPLQQIDENYPLFVTLNPIKKVKESDIFGKFIYHHPVFDEFAIKAQGKIDEIQGLDGFYYVGAYQANGFHEDGLASAVKVAKLFGVEKL